MAWIYFPASVESASRSSLGCAPSATSKLNRTARPFYRRASGTGISVTPRFGTTLPPLILPLGPDEWTSSLAGSHVSTSALQARERDWRESAAAFFGRSSGVLARFDPPSSSWRTSQLSLNEEETRWSEPLPRSGMIVGGEFYRLTTWERRTKGSGGGVLLPTLVARGWKNSQGKTPFGRSAKNLPSVLYWKHGIKGPLKPSGAEVFMGYPVGWTELKDSEMQSYRKRRGKRSRA